MQPKTNHNYLFVVLLRANMNIIQKHTHDVWSSSKFRNRSLVSGGCWVPLSWTSSLSSLNDTHTHTHSGTHVLNVTLARSTPHCHWGSLPRLPAASLAGAFFPRHCFRLPLSVSTAVRLLTQECGQHSWYIVLQGWAAYFRCEMQTLACFVGRTPSACVYTCVHWISF